MIKMIKRPLSIGRNKKVLDHFTDELEGKIITETATVRLKTYAYLRDDGSNHKKAKGTKKCVIKQKLVFENYKYCFSIIKLYIVHTNDLKAITMLCTQKK